MFKKKDQIDIKKSIQKVIDNKRDNIQRLKHLKIFLDNSQIQDAKNFFEQNFSLVFYVFYDVFINVESDLKKSVNRAHKDELETVLFIFEKVLVLLPELIHKRWQFRCVSRLLKKLLHDQNSLKIRRDGVRLFVIWYQILQDQASPECHFLFSKLVSQLGTDPDDGDGGAASRMPSSTSTGSLSGACAVIPVEIVSILPRERDEQLQPPSEELRILLTCMVSECCKVEWPEPKEIHRIKAFRFLFGRFRRHYLLNIFPAFSYTFSLYSPMLVLPNVRAMSFESDAQTTPSVNSYENFTPQQLLTFQDVVIRWLAEFACTSGCTVNCRREKDTHGSMSTAVGHFSATSQDGDSFSISFGGSTYSPQHSHYLHHLGDSINAGAVGSNYGASSSSVQQGSEFMYGGTEATGSNHSTLSMQSNLSDGKSLENWGFTEDQILVVRAVIYSTREDVNFVHELFRLALNFPMQYHMALRKIIDVYNGWIHPSHQASKNEVPPFMLEPEGFSNASMASSTVDSSTTQAFEVSDSSSASTQLVVKNHCSSLRTESYISATDAFNAAVNIEPFSVRAGLHRVAQVFITHSAAVFFTRNQEIELVDAQVHLCQRVLFIVERMVKNKRKLSADTWKQLLTVLLHVTQGVLGRDSATGNVAGVAALCDSVFAKKLACNIFRSLIFTWLHASLQVHLSQEMWDRLLDVLSALTHWRELIDQWSKVMDMLTKKLSQEVYKLDLNHLPLDKLSEQKEKRRRNYNRQTPSKSRKVSTLRTTRLSIDALSNLPDDNFTSLIKSEQLHSMSSSMSMPNTSSVISNCQLTVNTSADVVVSLNNSPHNSNVTNAGTIDVSNSSSNFHTSGGVTFPASESELTDSVADSARMSGSEYVLVDDTEEHEVSSVTSSRREDADGDSSSFASAEDIGNDHIDEIDSEYNLSIAALSDDAESRIIRKHGRSHRNRYHGEDTGSRSSGSATRLSSQRRIISSGTCDSSHTPSPMASDDETIGIDALRRVAVNLNISQEKGGTLTRAQELQPHAEFVDKLSIKAAEVEDPEPTLMASCENLTAEENPGALTVLTSGGQRQGWNTDSAVVLWRRILGCLGDINLISDQNILYEVYRYLTKLTDTLLKIQANQGVPTETKPDSTAVSPNLTPPITVIVPWLFNALHLGYKFKKARLAALRLLCRITVRRHDSELPSDHIVLFYRELHAGLTGSDQEIINEIIRSCGRQFFSMPLPGSSILLLDFIHGAHTVCAQNSRLFSNIDASDIILTRREAIAIFGSLICFPSHYPGLRALTPNPDRDLTLSSCEDVKSLLVKSLLHCGRKEPYTSSRCLALACLTVFVYEELSVVAVAADDENPSKIFGKVRECLTVLICTMRMLERNPAAALIAIDMIGLLCDHVMVLSDKLPEMPVKIIQFLCGSMYSLISLSELNSAKFASLVKSGTLRLLVVRLINVLLEWCMHLPFAALLETSDAHTKGLVFLVFQVLHLCANLHTDRASSSGMAAPGHFLNSAHFLPELQLECEVDPLPEQPCQWTLGAAATSSAFSNGSPQLTKGGNEHEVLEVVRLAARTAIIHLVNHLGHFPKGYNGAARLNSTVQECNDLDIGLNDLRQELFDEPNIQFFVLNNSILLSFVEISNGINLPTASSSPQPLLSSLATNLATTIGRIIIRDVAGKFCWDTYILYGGSTTPRQELNSSPRSVFDGSLMNSDIRGGGGVADHHPSNKTCSAVFDSSGNANFDQPPTPPPRASERNQGQLPSRQRSSSFTWVQFSPDAESEPLTFSSTNQTTGDYLDELLLSIGESSPECLIHPGQLLNIPAKELDEASKELEAIAQCQIIEEEKLEDVRRKAAFIKTENAPPKQTPTHHQEAISPFQMCRHLLCQLGFLDAENLEKRTSLDLLVKNERLIRELRNLDKCSCRETHKIAVLYISEGQEDKHSILSNNAGSRQFEAMVAGLGWEVPLDTHPGFLGGLNSKCGASAPYYATSTLEVIFHVATRMPSQTTEDMHRKTKHLGNDEVMVIWSEHRRDFRRNIIRTDFGDVLIEIYPQSSGLFRIGISRKAEVPFFGPLFDGAIVNERVLPGLIRTTAVNASRAMRALKPYYLTCFEERARCLSSIVEHHKEKCTFEDFAMNVFAPVLCEDAILPGTPLDQMSFPGSASSRENLLNVPERNAIIDERTSPTGSKNVASTTTGSASIAAAGCGGGSSAASAKNAGSSNSEISRSSTSRLSWPPGIKFRVRFGDHSNAENNTTTVTLSGSSASPSPINTPVTAALNTGPSGAAAGAQDTMPNPSVQQSAD